jgi:hypothetical protein
MGVGIYQIWKISLGRWIKALGFLPSPQPTVLSMTLSVTIDQLIFEENERQPDDSLILLMEGVSRLDSEEKFVIRELVEGILLKHEARRLVQKVS